MLWAIKKTNIVGNCILKTLYKILHCLQCFPVFTVFLMCNCKNIGLKPPSELLCGSHWWVSWPLLPCQRGKLVRLTVVNTLKSIPSAQKHGPRGDCRMQVWDVQTWQRQIVPRLTSWSRTKGHSAAEAKAHLDFSCIA